MIHTGFDLELDGDQQAIAQLFQDFFAKEVGAERVRSAEPLGFDAELWEALCGLGGASMSLAAEAVAGAGATRCADLVVACEEFGRCVAPVPWIEHLAAAPLVPESDVLEGRRIVTLALHPAGPDGRWRLVPAGAVAHTVVGLDGDELVRVSSDPPWTSPANHGSAPIADRSTTQGERVVLGSRADFVRALDRWRLLTSAALVGIAAKAQDLALGYVRERRQFGRPIGAYQAIQHGIADFPARLDGARMLTHKAAWAWDENVRGATNVDEGEIRDACALTAMAFCFSSEAAAFVTDRSLHYHGSYGFSREYEIGLYYRRARAWPLLLGDPARERARLADLLWPVEHPLLAEGD